MKPIASGSCYLDKGESQDYVTAQIKRMAKMKPEYYYFDVICLPSQIPQATRLLLYFYLEVRKYMPELSDEKVCTAITCDDKVRPAMMAMLMMNKGNIGGVADLNPSRKGHDETPAR